MVESVGSLGATFTVEGSQAQSGINQIVQSINRLQQSVNRLAQATTKGFNQVDDRIQRSRKSTVDASRKTRQAIEAQRTTLQRVRKSNNQVAESSDLFNERMRELTKSVQIALGPLSGVAARITAFTGLLNTAQVAIAATVASFIGLSFGIFKATQAAVRFEDGIIRVAKTANLTDSEVDSLSEQIIQMSGRLQTGTAALFDIAEAAGQMGLQGVKNIKEFTEAVAIMANTTNLKAGEAAKQLARLINITGQSPQVVGNLVSVIVELGNTTAAAESEIVELATEIARASAGFNFGAQNAAALAASLKAMGARTESAGTAVGKLVASLDSISKRGGVMQDQLAALAGVTKDEFSRAFEKDALEATALFAQGVQQSVAAGNDLTRVMEFLGVTAVREQKVLRSFLTNAEILGEKMEQAAEQFEEPTAAIKEFGKQAGTASRLLEGAGANIQNILKEIGDSFLGSFKGIIGAFRDLTIESEFLAKSIQILVIGLGAAGLTAVVVNLGDALLSLLTKMTRVTRGAGALRNAMVLLGGPIGVLVTLVGTVALSFLAFRDNMTAAEKQAKRTEEAVANLRDRIAAVRKELSKGGLDELEIEVRLRLDLQDTQENLQEAARIAESQLRSILDENRARFGLPQAGLPQGLESFLGGAPANEEAIAQLDRRFGQVNGRVGELVRNLLDLRARLSAVGQELSAAEKRASEFVEAVKDPIDLITEDELKEINKFTDSIREARDELGQLQKIGNLLDLGGTQLEISASKERFAIEQELNETLSGVTKGKLNFNDILALEGLGTRPSDIGGQLGRVLRGTLSEINRQLGTTAKTFSELAEQTGRVGESLASQEFINDLKEGNLALQAQIGATSRLISLGEIRSATEAQIAAQIEKSAELSRETNNLSEEAVQNAIGLAGAEARRKFILDSVLSASKDIRKAQEEFVQSARAVEALERGASELEVSIIEAALEAERLVDNLTRDLSQSEINQILAVMGTLLDANIQSAEELQAKLAEIFGGTARNEAKASIEGLISEQERALKLARAEIGLVGETESQRRTALAVLERKLELQAEFGGALSAERQELLRIVEATEMAKTKTEELDRAHQKLEDIATRAFDNIGSSLTRAFIEGADAAEVFREVALNVIDDLFNAMIELAITNPLKNMLFNQENSTITDILGLASSFIGGFSGSGVPGGGPPTIPASPFNPASMFAKGGVFNNGNVVKFAEGGLVSGPTSFPMSGGKVGLMGESGPEAVMPLTRTSSGELGIKSDTRSDGGDGDQINVTIQLSTGVQQTVRAELMQMLPSITESVKDGVVNAKRRGGRFKQNLR